MERPDHWDEVRKNLSYVPKGNAETVNQGRGSARVMRPGMATGPESKTKAERMASGSLSTFGSSVVIRLATIVNSIIIVRVLGVLNVGIYSVVTLTVSVAGVVASFGIPSALVKFLAEVPPDRPEDASRLIRTGLLLTLVATAAAAGGLMFLSPFLAILYGESQIQGLLVIASVGLILSVVPGPLIATFQAYELIRERSVLAVASTLISVPVAVILVVGWGLAGAVVGTVVGNAATIAVNLPLLRRVWRDRRLSWSVPRTRSVRPTILGYAVPTLLGGLLVTFVSWFTGTYLAASASLNEVGLYAVGSSLAGYLLFIPTAIGMPLIPIVSRLDRLGAPELPAFLMRTLRVTAFLLIPPTLILIAFPQPFLATLFGSEFMVAASVVQIVVPAFFLAGVATVVGFGIAGKGRMWHGLFVNLLWGVVFVSVSLAIVPTRAALGLSLAFLAGYAAQFLGILVYVRYVWSIGIQPLMVPLAIAMISSAVLLALRYLVIAPGIDVAMGAFIIAVCVSELLAMTPRELEVLGAPIRRLMLWLSTSH